MYSEIITKTKGTHLPHWQTKDGIYFVTFRLAGSLPSHLKKNRELLKEEIVKNSKKRSLAPFEVDELEDIHFEEMRLKRHDKGHAFLQDDRIAQIVADALQYFDNDHYRLYAWSVMPNHVHIVVQPLQDRTLQSIIRSWKTWAARNANLLLGRTGAFWQEEYYDHLIRDESDLQRCMEYTYSNAETVGMKDWKWQWKMERETLEKLLTEMP